MTPQFWQHIQPQLDEIIFNELSDANPAYILLETLQDPYWWDKAPFKDMRVWDERNDMTFICWMNAMSSLMGDKMSDIFEQELIARLRNTIGYQNEIRMKELGEKEEFERRTAA